VVDDVPGLSAHLYLSEKGEIGGIGGYFLWGRRGSFFAE
jgi:hypothetical protein